MPGESPQTIKETAEFAAYCLTLSKWTNPHNMSINYAQALPGTPLYEFARKKGLVKTSVEGEEEYLLDVSDKNASDPIVALNFTEYPTILYWSWKFELYLETLNAYIKKYGMEQYYLITTQSKANIPLIDLITEKVKLENDKIPSFIKLLLVRDMEKLIIFHPLILYRVKGVLPLFMLATRVKRLGYKRSFEYLKDYLLYLIKGHEDFDTLKDSKSLRVTVNKELPPIETDLPAMVPLRKGRW